MEKEVCTHPQVMSCTRLEGKTKHSLAAHHESLFNCKVDLESDDRHIEYTVTVGYSRFKDKAGWTHGWVMFGKGCTSMESRVEGVVLMLNVCGFESHGKSAFIFRTLADNKRRWM